MLQACLWFYIMIYTVSLSFKILTHSFSFLLWQDDKDLVHEFVVAEGLTCLIKVGAEADQNYQNYILRGKGNASKSCFYCSEALTGLLQLAVLSLLQHVPQFGPDSCMLCRKIKGDSYSPLSRMNWKIQILVVSPLSSFSCKSY